MADIVLNIGKGRVAEFYNRVKSNDPANSALIIVPVDAGGTTDATIRDFATLAAALAGGLTERNSNGWARKVLTDADLAALAVDNVNDRVDLTIPTQTWTAVTTGAVTDLLICYDGDTTAGTDANIIPLVLLDFAITPDGSDVQAVPNASGFYRAS